MSGAVAQPSLAERAAEISWYHTLELPGGITTPGSFDTLDELARVPLPASLEGRRCLDVGTADGFWAFEMERRGAAEVVAIDLRDPARFDWPTPMDSHQRGAYEREYARPRGFDLAHRALRSTVEWRELSVYELGPDRLGTFDFVFMGSLLLHLRDPVAALMAIRGVLQGELLSVDAVSPLLTALHPRQPIARFEAPGWPMWWTLNLSAYRRLFGAAGLEVLAGGRPFPVRRGPAYASSPRSPRLLSQRARDALVTRVGILHAWVRARPA